MLRRKAAEPTIMKGTKKIRLASVNDVICVCDNARIRIVVMCWSDNQTATGYDVYRDKWRRRW